MGTIDSINYFERGIKDGTIKLDATETGWIVSGDTYKIGQYLKRDYNARWNKEEKHWAIDVDDCYRGGREHYHYGIFSQFVK